MSVLKILMGDGTWQDLSDDGTHVTHTELETALSAYLTAGHNLDFTSGVLSMTSANVYVGSVAYPAATNGDLWYDTNSGLKIRQNNAWVAVGSGVIFRTWTSSDVSSSISNQLIT